MRCVVLDALLCFLAAVVGAPPAAAEAFEGAGGCFVEGPDARGYQEQEGGPKDSTGGDTAMRVIINSVVAVRVVVIVP